MNEVIFLVEETVEGGYQARALGHSIHTQADSLPELREQVRDAVNCHFDANALPALIRLHFVREEVLTP
ncbi:MAG TPA: 2-oxoisovalerate dehydrogenase [Plasticicumulans sp.]|nr:2-oxoisovalerate dehydrogenase [Plasticicumulans sp.]HMW42636.1 2-oxoisovalerate dehydrogenase [Plasticicumulans sp.]HNB90267.1 2-oxoisovalerate dehydrogenase [Plasticicumulans sp.]